MSSSLSEQASRRKEASTSVRWTVCGVISAAALGVLACRTASEVFGLFAGMPAKVSPSMGEGKEAKARDWSRVTSDELLSVARGASAGLERWKSTAAAQGGTGGSVGAAGDRLLAAFAVIQEEVTALQDSLAKSRSVGSVVGLVSWDLDQAQASLKEEQTVVLDKSGQVHALARRIIGEHEEYQSGNGGGVVDGGGESSTSFARRQAGEEQELMNKLTYGLAEADVEAMLVRLGEVEGEINAAITMEEAQEMAAQYAAATRARQGKGGIGQSHQPTDEDIARNVQEFMPLAMVHTSPENCVSMATAQNITRVELERYGADRTGIPDYAMGPAGARVIPSLTSDTYEPPMGFVERLRSKRRKASLQAVSQPPVAINPESRLGRCWPMQGSDGKLTVKLSQPINVNKISIEHAPRELLLNKGISALKDFTVVGYPKGLAIGDETSHVLVRDGEYSLEGDVIQFFDVAHEYRRMEYAAVALEVDSNHGEGAYTCIYRFRVHGSPSS